MSFVNNMTAYVASHAKEIAIKAVSSAKTAKLLIANNAVTAGVKGSARINKMDSDVTFQSGATCGRSALGNTTLSDLTIAVTPIKDVQDFCAKALYDTYFSTMLAKGQNPATETISNELMGQIMDFRGQLVANAVEQLLWNGDTALTTNTTLKWFDGLRKQIKAGAYVNADPEDKIATFGAITAGTGYANAVYPAVALTGGTGTGATANITVAGTVVTVVTLVAAGTGYTVGDVLSATAASIGGTGSGFAIPVATLTAPIATLGGKFQSAYLKIPIAVRTDPGFRIWMGEDHYASYLIELDNANKYREVSANTLSGTTAKIETVPGLNGTNEVYFARFADLHLGMDGTDEIDKAVLKFNDMTELWNMDFHFAVGIKAVQPAQIGYANFS